MFHASGIIASVLTRQTFTYHNDFYLSMAGVGRLQRTLDSLISSDTEIVRAVLTVVSSDSAMAFFRFHGLLDRN